MNRLQVIEWIPFRQQLPAMEPQRCVLVRYASGMVFGITTDVMHQFSNDSYVEWAEIPDADQDVRAELQCAPWVTVPGADCRVIEEIVRTRLTECLCKLARRDDSGGPIKSTKQP